MNRRIALLAPAAVAISFGIATIATANTVDEHWPRWRGPLGTGVSEVADPPISWSETENLRFKIEIPGKGTSTPISWGNSIYLLSAVPVPGEGEASETPKPPPETGGRGGRGGRGSRGGRGGRGGRSRSAPTVPQQFTVMAIHRESGDLQWSKVVNEGVPHEGTHGDGSWASASAVTDGELILAHFGSNGLYALDMQGEVLWEKQLGKMRTRNGFGEGASPAIWGDTVLVQWDHEGDSFVVALDRKTGDEKWRHERDEVTSWATPVVVEVDGKMQAICNATERIRGYDLETGEVIWECGGMTTNAIPTPVIQDGVAYIMSGFRGSKLVAIQLAGAAGDITDSQNVKWSFDKDTPYVPSPLLQGELLYFLKSNTGILSIFDIEKGERVIGPERLESVRNVYASPVAAKGRVYIVSRDGDCEVLEVARGDDGAELKVLARNHIDEGVDASPTLLGDAIFLRGQNHLYCFANEG